jgi:hypothetical protein
MSDILEASRGTRLPQSKPEQGTSCDRPELLESQSCRSKTGSEVTRLVLGDQIQCSTNKHTRDDFVDEGYSSPSPTESDTGYFSESGVFCQKPNVNEAQPTPQIAPESSLPQLPQICVTDEKGETEIIAADDDEHGQLWDFARDKIARRMFLVRADRRAQHMASTFYADLYPVSDLIIRGQLRQHF